MYRFAAAGTSASSLADGRRWAGLVLLAAVSFAGGQIAATLRYPELGSGVLFPPYAALTASLVVLPRRDWIWCVLIASATHFATHWPAWPLTWVLAAACANAVRALTAAYGLGRVLGKRPRIDSLRSLTLFVFVAVALAPAAGAAIGAANVVWHGASTSYWRTFAAWFVSNALTGLTMMPAMLAVFSYVAGHSRSPVRGLRLVEASLLTSALALACTIAFLSDLWRVHAAVPFYATLPVLIWAAVRFGTHGASATLTVVAGAAVWSVDHGLGPFLAVSPDDNVFALQIFILCTAAPILCLAALASARESVLHLYRALLASQQDHVALLDADGVIIEANASWRGASLTSRSGWQTPEVGQGCIEACEVAVRTGDESARQMLGGLRDVLARDRTRVEMEYDVSDGGGLEAYAVTIEPLERAAGGAVVTRRNITARRLAQVVIQDQHNQLSHLTRVSALGHVAGALAHELRQPLTAILSNAEAGLKIVRQAPLDLEAVDAILADVVLDDHRAVAVIEHMRALLRRSDVQFQEVELKDVVDGVLALTRAELMARQVELTVRVAPGLPALWGDPIHLQQVLLNLVLNGCEAMTVTSAGKRLWVSADPDGAAAVHVAVRDSGPGIPPALLPELFKPFVTTKESGLGLGLSISNTIIRTHGGRLWAENHPDGGAVLHCVLPARQVHAERLHGSTM